MKTKTKREFVIEAIAKTTSNGDIAINIPVSQVTNDLLANVKPTEKGNRTVCYFKQEVGEYTVSLSVYTNKAPSTPTTSKSIDDYSKDELLALIKKLVG